MLRVFSASDAVRNVRREVVEHRRVVAEIDALAQRVAPTVRPLHGESVEAELRAS
jgi:hypothetical protein